jgi:hypothetical protein
MTCAAAQAALQGAPTRAPASGAEAFHGGPGLGWEQKREQDVLLLVCGGGCRLPFKGSDEDTGFWNKGISACAVCDGAAPMFRNKPIAVIGGGDSGARGMLLC